MCLDTNTYLKKLEDLVLSEEKIITYKWLSKKLSVHTNTSKQLLYWFYKKNKDEVRVTYMMSGFEQEGGVKVSLVRGDDLVAARQAFTKVISEHVYSVHKTSNLDDSLRSLCLTDRLQPTKLSSIVPREVGERQVRNRVCEPPPPRTVLPTRPSTTAPTPSKANEKKTKSPSPVKSAVPVVSPKKSAKKPSSAPKGGIGAMFKKQEEKSHLSNLKSKTNKKLETVRKEASPELEGNRQDEVVEKEKDISEQDGDKSLEPVKAVKEKGKKVGEKKRTAVGSGSKRKKASARSESSKKRRRINVMSDSDSDESEEEEEEQEEEPPAQEQQDPFHDSDDEVIPPTPHGKHSIRRLVNKTYTDDEGFIVTRKEYVYESCEEGEEASEKKSKQDSADATESGVDTTESRTDATESRADATESRANATESRAATTESRAATTKTSKSTKSSPSKPKSNKKNSPHKNKQQSIMNFFKKK